MTNLGKLGISLVGIAAVIWIVPRAIDRFATQGAQDTQDTQRSENAATPVTATDSKPADGWVNFGHGGGCQYTYLNPPRSTEPGVYDYWSRTSCEQPQVDHINDVEHVYFARREKARISCGIEEFSVGDRQYYDAAGNETSHVETGEYEDDIGNGVAVPGTARSRLVDQFCYGKPREWVTTATYDDCTVAFLEPAMMLADGNYFLWKRLSCASVQNDGEIPGSAQRIQFSTKLLRNHVSCRSEKEYTVYQEYRDATGRTLARWANVDPDPLALGARVYDIADEDGELIEPDSVMHTTLAKYCKT